MDEKKTEDTLGKICRALARQSLMDMAKVIDKVPMDEMQKQASLLTTIVSLLNETLNSFYEHNGDDVLLQRKLEFLRLVRSSFVEEHKRRKETKKEKPQ